MNIDKLATVLESANRWVSVVSAGLNAALQQYRRVAPLSGKLPVEETVNEQSNEHNRGGDSQSSNAE